MSDWFSLLTWLASSRVPAGQGMCKCGHNRTMHGKGGTFCHKILCKCMHYQPA